MTKNTEGADLPTSSPHEDVPRFIVGDIIDRYNTHRQAALHPRLLFNMLMALDTIQCVSARHISVPERELREQVYGQFKTDFENELIREGAMELDRRSLIIYSDGVCVITELGERVASTVRLGGDRIEEYRRLVQDNDLPSIPVNPETPIAVRRSHLCLVS